jgi:hypothetical protein
MYRKNHKLSADYTSCRRLTRAKSEQRVKHTGGEGVFISNGTNLDGLAVGGGRKTYCSYDYAPRRDNSTQLPVIQMFFAGSALNA